MLSGLTDLADGYIARRFHGISNLGKILDPVADKLTQAAMLICLFTRFPHVLLLIAIMAGKELYMVVSGCLAFICIPLYNETLRGCFTVGEKKKYQKNDD